MLLSEYIQTVRVILQSLQPPEVVLLEHDRAFLRQRMRDAARDLFQPGFSEVLCYKSFDTFDPFLFEDGTIGWSGAPLAFAVWTNITIAHLVRLAMTHFFKTQPKEVEVEKWQRLGQLMLESIYSANWPERFLSKVDDCTICTEPLYVCIQTSCGHEFHALCLEQWLRTETTCPLCREEL